MYNAIQLKQLNSLSSTCKFNALRFFFGEPQECEFWGRQQTLQIGGCQGNEAKIWWTARVRKWKVFCWSSMKSLKLADRSLHSSVPLHAALGHHTTGEIRRTWCRRLPGKGFIFSCWCKSPLIIWMYRTITFNPWFLYTTFFRQVIM